MDPVISYDYSGLLTSAILTGNHFVVCGSCGEIVGDSLSYLMDGQSAGQIFLDNTSINSFHSQLQRVPNRVILVHNALNTFNEGIFLSAGKLCLSKVLFFICEDKQTYLQFPTHWGNYALFLFPEEFCYEKNSDVISSADFDLMNASYDKEDVQVEKDKDLRRMKKLLPNRTSLRLEAICKLNKEVFASTPLTIPLLQHLQFLCKDKPDDFHAFLSKSSADTRTKELFIPKMPE